MILYYGTTDGEPHASTRFTESLGYAYRVACAWERVYGGTPKVYEYEVPGDAVECVVDRDIISYLVLDASKLRRTAVHTMTRKEVPE